MPDVTQLLNAIEEGDPHVAEKLLPLLKDLGRLYGRGAISKIDSLDFLYLELPEGGHLRLTLTDVPPQSMRQLEEWLTVLAGIVRRGDQTEVNLRIDNPDEKCALIQKLKEGE